MKALTIKMNAEHYNNLAKLIAGRMYIAREGYYNEVSIDGLLAIAQSVVGEWAQDFDIMTTQDK